MFLSEALRWSLAILLALMVAASIDVRARGLARKRMGVVWIGLRYRALVPPGFSNDYPGRRLMALLLLAFVLLNGVFLGLAFADQPPEIDLESLSPMAPFAGHVLLLGAVVGWVLLGWFGLPPVRTALPGLEAASDMEPGEGDDLARGRAKEGDSSWVAALGLRVQRPLDELVWGVVGGVAGWLIALGASLVVAVAIAMLSTSTDLDFGWLETEPSPLLVWIAALPIGVRIALSVSAGVVEELFFRGLLQPRIGLWASTVCFVLGHLAYGQPMMVVGLTALSLFYGWLAIWRRSIWAPIIAHTLFDLVQMLLVVPWALELASQSGS
ncbi:MAG: CPBP family intramembrane glutamic endopeptidase [Acidobacteriota bacterium]